MGRRRGVVDSSFFRRRCATASDEVRTAAHACVRFLRCGRKAEGCGSIHGGASFGRRKRAISRPIVRVSFLEPFIPVVVESHIFSSSSSSSSLLLPRIDWVSSAHPVGASVMLLGGFGFLSRLHGLSIDNLVEAEVVLADGRIVIVNEKEYPGALLFPFSAGHGGPVY